MGVDRAALGTAVDVAAGSGVSNISAGLTPGTKSCTGDAAPQANEISVSNAATKVPAKLGFIYQV